MTRLANRNVVPLDISGIKIIATAVSGGNNDRRIARYRSIGVNGADLEDLGQDERQDGYTATVAEYVFLQLEAIKEAGKPVTIVHPIFGTYQGRLASCKYTATTRSGVEISLTLIEDGTAAKKNLNVVQSLPAWSGAANAAWSLANESILDLASLDDLPTDIFTAIGDLTTAWNAFSAVGDLVAVGAATFDEISATLTDLGSAVDSMISTVDNAWGVVEGIADIALEDTLYPLMAAARGVADSVRATTSGRTIALVTAGATSLADIARKYLGRDDDDAIDLILAQNPSQIDSAWVPSGMSLTIPIE